MFKLKSARICVPCIAWTMVDEVDQKYKCAYYKFKHSIMYSRGHLSNVNAIGDYDDTMMMACYFHPAHRSYQRCQHCCCHHCPSDPQHALPSLHHASQLSSYNCLPSADIPYHMNSIIVTHWLCWILRYVCYIWNLVNDINYKLLLLLIKDYLEDKFGHFFRNVQLPQFRTLKRDVLFVF